MICFGMVLNLLLHLSIVCSSLGDNSILYNTKELTFGILSDQIIKQCTTQGYSYFDSTLHSCGKCSLTGQTSDTSLTSINIYGDPTGCTCQQGYIKNSNDCASVSITLEN